MPKKSNLLFFVVVIFSFVLMTYQSREGTIMPNTFINGLLNSSHATAQSFVNKVRRPFVGMFLREEENMQLKKRIGELVLERGRYEEAILENRRLKELLKLQDSRTNIVTTARVIARGVDHWAHTLILDKGIRNGIAKDMTAITPQGLAGKILDVSESYAYLLLLTDINFSAAVRLQESRREGIVSGTGSKTTILKYMPYETAVKSGDVVITSGLDLLFPPGIPIGYISNVDNTGKGGKFQYIEVTPYQDDSSIEEVIIVR